MRGSRLVWLAPLLLFAGVIILMAKNIGNSPEAIVRSHMVGKPVPEFAFAGSAGLPGLQTADLRSGQPVLVNLFASWCVPCAIEAPQLEELRRKGAPLVGLAIRDSNENITAFVGKHGNPFSRIGLDTNGVSMLALGASGVPETYVVDGRGVIRFQHIGEIRPEHVPVLLRELEKAR